MILIMRENVVYIFSVCCIIAIQSENFHVLLEYSTVLTVKEASETSGLISKSGQEKHKTLIH